MAVAEGRLGWKEDPLRINIIRVSILIFRHAAAVRWSRGGKFNNEIKKETRKVNRIYFEIRFFVPSRSSTNSRRLISCFGRWSVLLSVVTRYARRKISSNVPIFLVKISVPGCLRKPVYFSSITIYWKVVDPELRTLKNNTLWIVGIVFCCHNISYYVNMSK